MKILSDEVLYGATYVSIQQKQYVEQDFLGLSRLFMVK
jgi:hypothetical protein